MTAFPATPPAPPQAPRSRHTRARLSPAPSPSISDKLRRGLWAAVEATLYRWSPTPLHIWRRLLLRLFGARIARGAHPYPSVRVWAPWNLVMDADSSFGPRVICYSVAPIRLGVGVVVSQGAHLCAASHDHRDPAFTLLTGPIVIEDHAWVAADAFIGPGVTIGARAVVGARAAVFRDVAADVAVGGNPAAQIGGGRVV